MDYTSAYTLPDELIAAGLAAQAKYSGAHGGPVVHDVLPMPTHACAGMPGYARPTHAWQSNIAPSADEAYGEHPQHPAPARSGAGGGAGGSGGGRRSADGTLGPPSCLTRPAREPYREKQVQYVGIAHARISFDDEENAKPEHAAAFGARGQTQHQHGQTQQQRVRSGASSGGGGSRNSKQPQQQQPPPQQQSQRGVSATRKPFCASAHTAASARRPPPTPSAALGTSTPTPTSRSRAVPSKVAEVLSRDSSGAAVDGIIDGEGFGAAVQVASVIHSLEAELQELNGQYARCVNELRHPVVAADGIADDHALQARLRGLVLSMEQKAAQLAALRRTHTSLTESANAVRSELLTTRGALKQAAETAAARFQRIKKLESAAR